MTDNKYQIGSIGARKAALPKKSSLHKSQEFSLNSSLIIITVSVFRGREPAGQVRAGQATDLKRSGGAAEWCELSKKTSALTSEAFQNALCCLGLERGLVVGAAAAAAVVATLWWHSHCLFF